MKKYANLCIDACNVMDVIHEKPGEGRIRTPQVVAGYSRWCTAIFQCIEIYVNCLIWMHRLQRFKTFAIKDWIKTMSIYSCLFHHCLLFTLNINVLLLQGKKSTLLVIHPWIVKTFGVQTRDWGCKISHWGCKCRPWWLLYYHVSSVFYCILQCFLAVS